MVFCYTVGCFFFTKLMKQQSSSCDIMSSFWNWNFMMDGQKMSFVSSSKLDLIKDLKGTCTRHVRMDPSPSCQLHGITRNAVRNHKLRKTAGCSKSARCYSSLEDTNQVCISFSQLAMMINVHEQKC